jgi:C1A family cysteine protease
MKQRYNWIPDRPDARDFKYSKRAEKFGIKVMPSKVDLTPVCSNVENQGQIGSCTANALVGNLEFLEKKDSHAKSPKDLSRLFVYYNERSAEHTVGQDGGAQLRDGIKVLHKMGVCDEAKWPYDAKLLFERPSSECFDQALGRRISVYERVSNLSEMKDCLASGFPFVFGFKVYSGFESPEVARTGVMNLPTGGETLLGGHAVMAVGYDDHAERFIVRNSWGPQWGQNGYFTMPYVYLTTKDLASDFWTIHK